MTPVLTVAEYTALMGAIAATCAALTGVSGILFGLRIWWRNRGKDGLKNWVHETSGAAAVARTTASGLESVRDELSKAVTSLNDRHASLENLTVQRAAALEELTEARHRESQLALSGVSGAQDRTAIELRNFVDEHLHEAEQRDQAIAKLNETQVRITETLEAVAAECRTHARIAETLEAVAAEARAHARSRKKHPARQSSAA